jgi:hypothetical protein
MTMIGSVEKDLGPNNKLGVTGQRADIAKIRNHAGVRTLRTLCTKI